MISLVNVTKQYPPEQVALKGATLSIDPGEFVFIAGASGAGKSTLLKLLFGAERPSAGELKVLGRDLANLTPRSLPFLRREIGVVFQDYKLLPRRTVGENVGFPLEVQGVPRDQIDERAQSLLRLVGLANRASALPQTLSGGEQQRVAIARALIHGPSLVIADEPTGNLDEDMTERVFDLFKEANQIGITVVVASHNLSMIEEMGYRTVVLDRGAIIGDFPRFNRK